VDTVSSYSDVNTIVNDTTGIVTATVTSGTAASLNSALVNASATDALTLTLTDTVLASGSDLIALNNKTSVDVNATSVTSITDTYANINAIYSGTGISGLGNEAVTISDTTSAANVNGILSKTSGVVTATVSSDTASNLNTALTNATSSDALTLSVTGTAAATDLNSLDGKTSVNVIVNATSVTGNFSDLNTLYVTNQANFSSLGDEAVTISDTVSAANANTIANLTTGIVTATVTSGTAASLNSALVNASSTDALTLTLTDTALASADDLIALDGKTSVAVNATSVTSITDTYADINTLFMD
jgi:hypothetical protein